MKKKRILPKVAPEIRFWRHVEKTEGCWIWKGAVTGYACSGMRYGAFCRSVGDVWRAHRFSYLMAYGEIPEGMCVCHKCDNPPCVRPDHLFLATHTENCYDSIRKGRAYAFRPASERHCVVGSKNPFAKLTEAKVFQLRRIRLKGMQVKRMAQFFGMKRKNMCAIVNGTRLWKHVPHPQSITDVYAPAA